MDGAMTKSSLGAFDASLPGTATPSLRRNDASVGRGGCERNWYYGCKLLLSLTSKGSSLASPAFSGAGSAGPSQY